MTSHPPTPALRMPSRGFLLATLGALFAVAAPASALLGLPVALPSADQGIDTPAGSVDASAGEQGASACSDLSTPALPALPAVPSLPVPAPVPSVPALPTPSAAANPCVSAGLDGASASAGVDAAGAHAGTGIAAESPVSQGEVEATAGQATGEAKGFLEGIIDTLFGWM